MEKSGSRIGSDNRSTLPAVASPKGLHGASARIAPPPRAEADAPPISNRQLVSVGLELLRGPLSLFVCRGIAESYGSPWWTEGVLETLVYEKAPTVQDVIRHRRLPESGTLEECADSLDVSACLILLTKEWSRIFGPVLGPNHRWWAFELIAVRQVNKDLSDADHPGDFTWRALDTMFRVCEPLDRETAEKILVLRSEVDLSSYRPVPGAVAAIEPATATADAGADDGRPDAPEEALEATGPDLSGADLRRMSFNGANLAGADFTRANLTDINLSGANLTRAVFTEALLGNADLTGADLTGAVFGRTAFSVTRYEGGPGPSRWRTRGANLSRAVLDRATLDFAGCDLRRVNLSGVNLAGADFTGANLSDANLSGADLTRAVFDDTQLGNTDLTGADLTGAVFRRSTLTITRYEVGPKLDRRRTRGANLSHATLDGATLDFAGCDLRAVNLSGTDLAGADFTDARLSDANLSSADLSRAILRNAKLDNADLTDANLAGAVFEHTTLSVTRYESGARLDKWKTRGANLSRATLDGAHLNFAHCDLQSVNLSETNLEGADFTHANLAGAHFEGACLRGATLKGANIQEAHTAGVQWD